MMQRTRGSGLGRAGLRGVVTMATVIVAAGAFSLAAPTGAQAAASGSSTARAVDVAIVATTSGAPALTPLLSRVDLSASTPLQTAPDAPGTSSSAVGLDASVPSLASTGTGVVVAAATRTAAGTSARSTVDAASVGVFGTTVLTSGVISSAVDCASGTPTATTNAAAVTVGGTRIVDGQVGTVPMIAAGVDGASVRVAVASPQSVHASSADATGLLVTLTLQGTLRGTATAVSIPLGQVSLAASTCTSAAAAAAGAPTIQSISPASGPTKGGQQVTLTGTGFGPGTGVTFGGVPATGVTVAGPTTLHAVTPAHAAGPVSVVAANTAGPSAPHDYTYVPPSIASISPDQGPTSGGQTVTISGAGFTPGSQVSIGGHPATNVQVNGADDRITATTPAGAAGPVDVTVTTPAEPTATLPGGYTYVAPPTVTDVSPNSGPAAGGHTVTVRGTGFVPGATTVTFGGTPAAAVTVVSGTLLRAVTPRGVGAVQVAVATPGGRSVAVDPYTFVAAAAGSGGGSGLLPYTGRDVAEWAGVSGWLLAAGAWLFLYGGHRRGALRRR